MSAPKKLAEFPDVEAKLQKAQKQSAFERERAEREAKRKREAEETAAVYESFVKSFDNDDDGDDIDAIARGGGLGGARGGYGTGAPPARAGLGGTGRRHFGAPARNSGPGPSLKSGPGSLGPPPTAFRGQRRGFDGGAASRDSYGRNESRGRLGFHNEKERELEKEKEKEYEVPKSISKAFDTGSDDEADTRGATDRAEERAVARPTLRLSNLPPGTSPAVIKALMPPNLTAENVKILPAASLGTSERKSIAAIVVLSQDTPATDMDAAVSALQNRYLGYGYYLSLHRHLSSAVASASVAAASLSSANASQPFGAKPVAQPKERAPQFQRGYVPPPTFYGPPGGGPVQRNILHVPVQAPGDIKQLQLIHKVVEAVLEHGPEFEALLMSRPDVQREEKWAWLWDARSEGGVWYRWRLWEIITGAQYKGSGKQGRYLPIFEDSHAWKAPEKPLIYEYTTKIDEFVSDSEYNSSDDEDYDDDGNKQGADGGENESTYLNPFDKAKLAHLLSRLPTALSRIRKGDIARVTTFAITHSSRGVDEIVDMIVSNVEKPFAITSANPDHKQSAKAEDEDASNAPARDDAAAAKTAAPSEPAADTSAASLVALYVVSDILSSSATSGVRHSWRFRQLFETALRERRVFERLGQTAERLSWGRMRAEKWKRSVGLVLGLWEGWCVFPAETQALFVSSFETPPPIKAAAEAGPEQAGGEVSKAAQGGRWKTVEARDDGGGAAAAPGAARPGFKPVAPESTGYDPGRAHAAGGGNGGMDVDVDGEPMDEDDDDWPPGDEPMDEDIDGVPMSDDDDVPPGGEPMDEDPPAPASPPPPPPPSEVVTAAERGGQEPPKQKGLGDAVEAADGRGQQQQGDGGEGRQQVGPRRRLRAVDMFADSDEGSNDGD